MKMVRPAGGKVGDRHQDRSPFPGLFWRTYGARRHDGEDPGVKNAVVSEVKCLSA